MTSDTASALNQQTTLLEALAQAVSNLQNQPIPTGNPPIVGQPLPAPAQPQPPSGGNPYNPFAGFSTALMAWFQQLTPQQQTADIALYQGLTPTQQQAFMALPLAQQEAYITAFNSNGVSGLGPYLPYNRINQPAQDVTTVPPTVDWRTGS
jgi:hypothetical protein